MRTLTLLSALLLSIINHAQDSVSVLFIGNSYTYVNDLPTVFSNLTLSLGDEATVDSKTNGGFTFQNHLTDPLTHTKIQSKPWDYVVLQGQSQEPSFPTSQVNTATLPPAVQLADSVYDNRYCSQAMYFMTWGRQVGDPQWDSINTFDKMNLRLRNAYVRFADSAQACVAPVGVAWKYVRDNHPTINLYSGDGSHPSPEGTYLAACTFYASVFRKSPVGAAYTFGLDPTVAGQLQAAAAISVLDSLDTWHIRATSDLAIADFHVIQNGNTFDMINDSWHAQSYSWDFGDGMTSTAENDNHTYNSDGTYTIQLIAYSECGNDTTTIQVSVNTAGLMVNEQDAVKIKTLGNGYFTVHSDAGVDSFELTDLSGKHVAGRKADVTEKEINLDLSDLVNGVYFLILNTESGPISLELPLLK
jgi:hypothetical protein